MLSKYIRIFCLVLSLIALGACSSSGDDTNKADTTGGTDTTTPDTTSPDTTTQPTPISMDEGIKGDLQDRIGRPGINTVLMFEVDKTDMKTAFNAQLPKDDADPNNAQTKYGRAIIDLLLSLNGTEAPVNLSGLDARFADVALTAEVLHTVLLLSGDALQINIKGRNTDPAGTDRVPVTDGYLAVETGFMWADNTPAFGGRRPQTDVVNVSLIALTKALLWSDCANPLDPKETCEASSNDKPFSDSFPYLATAH